MAKDLTFSEFKEAFDKIMPYLQKLYLGTFDHAYAMLNTPMYASFCDNNKEYISQSVIVMMALKIITERHGMVHWFMIDEWIEHFGPEVLKYLQEK